MYGTYSYSMDKKGRVFIPAKFREELGETFYICRSMSRDCCLSVYSKEEWQRLREQLRDLPTAKSLPVKRFIFGSAVNTGCDGTGRVVIPADLREFAKLEKDVTFVGMEDHAEIWDAEAFQAQQAAVSSDEIAALLEELGF